MNEKNKQNEGVFKNTRFSNANYTLLECPVTVKLKSKEVFQGKFVSFTPEYDVVLECSRKVEAKNEVQKLIERMNRRNGMSKKPEVFFKYIERNDIVEMTACNVDKDFVFKKPENNYVDSEITKRNSELFLNKKSGAKKRSTSNSGDSLNEYGKELEPFEFDDDDNDDLNNKGLSENLSNKIDFKSTSLELETFETLSGTGVGWCVEEMLLTNQTKYGYKSTYNSDLSEYTLAIERDNSEEYKRREEEAEKIAQEIESSSAYRSNVDKELSDGEEEEEAFSAVYRLTGEINNNNKLTSKSNKNYTNGKNNHPHKLNTRMTCQKPW